MKDVFKERFVVLGKLCNDLEDNIKYLDTFIENKRYTGFLYNALNTYKDVLHSMNEYIESIKPRRINNEIRY